jgi:hypothetical protein
LQANQTIDWSVRSSWITPGVGFWLKQLQMGQIRCPIILVAAQSDRGTCSLSPDELKAFCKKHGIISHPLAG